jgi:hypothetical protein
MKRFPGFPEEIIPLLQNHPVTRSARKQSRLWRDTSDFTSIDYGDVIHVDDRYFLVVGYTKEGRFGIDDQPKQWVPKVFDLLSGERCIMKLAFHETYTIHIGTFEVLCYRSPEKEARVIEYVRGNPYFMQGYATLDEAGNLVRILEVINGKRLDQHVNDIDVDHRTYLESHLRDILKHFMFSVEAICLLHSQGMKHGDIRRDHILVDYEDGRYRWIDFDYDFYLPERPFALDLFGLGNVLLYLVGRQNFRPFDIRNNPEWGERVLMTIGREDLSLVAGDRVFNLQKLFPYLPEELNNILLHFSSGTSVMYNSVEEFRDDLALCIETL